MGDSEIFHVQLLKMLTKNDPGNYDTIVLVRLSAEGLENDQEPDVPQLRNLCTCSSVRGRIGRIYIFINELIKTLFFF